MIFVDSWSSLNDGVMFPNSHVRSHTMVGEVGDADAKSESESELQWNFEI